MKIVGLATAFALAVSAGISFADEPIKRTDLVKKDIAISGLEVVQVRVDFGPGVIAQKHNHPGEEVAYVLKGTIVYKLEGQEPITLTEGQTLFIPSGVPHSAENVGSGTASELATYIVRKNEPIFVPFN